MVRSSGITFNCDEIKSENHRMFRFKKILVQRSSVILKGFEWMIQNEQRETM